MEKSKKKKEDEEEGQVEAAAGLWASVPSDLLPEILSRVPYRSLCRFKCVSTAWLALCSDPAVRRRSPQTLSGFFCHSFRDGGSGHRRSGLDFLNLSGRGQPLVDSSLHFLRGYRQVTPLHCCSGILICYCKKMEKHKAEYVVCNPATEEIWAVLTLRPNEVTKDLNTSACVLTLPFPGASRCLCSFTVLTGSSEWRCTPRKQDNGLPCRVNGVPRLLFLARFQDPFSLMALCTWLPILDPLCSCWTKRD